MIKLVYKIEVFLLFWTAVGSIRVQPKQIIYVNGTLDPSSWKNSVQFACSSVEVTVDGVKLCNSTQVVVKPKCKCKELQESVADVPHDPPCHTWFYPDPSLNGTCKCGDNVNGIVKCNDSTKQAFIRSCYCMTYNESMGPVVGACFYNLLEPTPIHTLYHLVPSNITEVNHCICGHLNREGQLCGKCKENYSIPVYSYEMKCVQCSTSPFNWVKYILVAFLPLKCSLFWL